MSDPEIFRSGRPHQVTMSEGSKVASGKKADGAAPSVRKVMASDRPAPESAPVEKSVVFTRVAPVAPAGKHQVFEGVQADQPDATLLPDAYAPEAVDESDSISPAAEADAALAADFAEAGAAPAHWVEVPEAAADDPSALAMPPSLAQDANDTVDAGQVAQVDPESFVSVPAELPVNDEFLTAPDAQDPAEAWVTVDDTSPEQDAAEGPVIEHQLHDTLVEVPESIAQAVDDEDGLVVGRDESDTRVSVPESALDAAADEGTLVENVPFESLEDLPLPEAGPDADEAEFVGSEEATSDDLLVVPEVAAESTEDVEGPLVEPAPPDNRVMVPASDVEDEAEEGLVFGREDNDTLVTIPETEAQDEANEGPVIVHAEEDTLVSVPEAAVEEEAAEAPIVESAPPQNRVAVPQAAAAYDDSDSPIIGQVMNRVMAAVPESDPEPDADEGPVVTRAEADNMVALPAAAPEEEGAEGLLVKRAEGDHMIALPADGDRLHSDPLLPALQTDALGDAVLRTTEDDDGEPVPGAAEPAPVEESGPSAEEVEAAAKAQALAATRMAQMDFPARVIKLKIRNDEIRVQLDTLEKPNRPRR